MPLPLVVAIGGAVIGLTSGALSLIPPLGEAFSQKTWGLYPNRIHDPNTLLLAKWRGIIDEDTYLHMMRLQGFNEEKAQQFELTNKFTPSPQDVVSWAQREAFLDDYAAQWGSDQMFPPQLIEYGKRVGMDEKELHYFWRAHWQIPSFMMVVDMWHRNIVDEQAVNDILKALDVMPGWWEAYKEASYSLPTRVDVRRMYRIGILDEIEVLQFYRSLGYSEKVAQALTEFTKEYEGEDWTELTRSQVLNAYEDGIFDGDTTRQYLQALGYNVRDVDFYLARIEYDRQKEIEDDDIEALIEQYKDGLIEEQSLVYAFNEMNLPAGQSELLIGKAHRERAKSVKVPSKTDLEVWFKRDIITQDEYETRLLTLGYTQDDVSRYVAENTVIEEGAERQPSKEDVIKWFAGELIDEGMFRDRMTQLGYPTWAIDLWVEQTQSVA